MQHEEHNALRMNDDDDDMNDDDDDGKDIAISMEVVHATPNATDHDDAVRRIFSLL